MKILTAKNDTASLRFVYLAMHDVEVDTTDHKRQWIGTYSNELIPLPPREVQDKIVEYLDTFAALCENLDTEIAQREQQFAECRGRLLSIARDESKEIPLGELAVIHNRARRPITKKDRTPGETPYYGASGVVDFVEGFTHDGDFLLVSEDGANLLVRTSPIAFSITGKNWVNNHAHVLSFDDPNLQRYVENFLESLSLAPFLGTAAQPKLTLANLKKIPISIPSDAGVQRVARSLDAMQAVIDNLRLELEQRQRQFDYYREKLLTFPEKDTTEV